MRVGMAINASITREELMVLLEAVTLQNAKKLAIMESGARGMWRDGHDTFCRELCELMSDALAQAGYCWARVPQRGDGLYRVMVEAASNVGSAHRVGLLSESASTREFARNMLADKILEYWKNTRTAVVRRKDG
jgi:hypothetical protein